MVFFPLLVPVKMMMLLLLTFLVSRCLAAEDEGNKQNNNRQQGTTQLIAILLTVFSGISLCIGACLPLLDKMVWFSRLVSRCFGVQESHRDQWKMLKSRAFLAGSLGFASGIMVYGTFASIVPEAIATLSSATTSIPDKRAAYIVAVAYACAGGLFMWVIDLVVHRLEGSMAMEQEVQEESNGNQLTASNIRHAGSGVEEPSSSSRTQQQEEEQDQPGHPIITTTTTDAIAIAPTSTNLSEGGADLTTASLPVWQIVIAISLHKIPEGLITYTGAISDFKFGLVIALAMLIHSLPEGIMAVLPVYYATKSVAKSVTLICIVAGLAQPLGGLIGFAVIGDGSHITDSNSNPNNNNGHPAIDNHVLGAFYAIVAGMQTVISLHSMLPVAVSQHRGYASRFLIAGVLFTALTFSLFEFTQ